MSDRPFRVLPHPDEDTAFFWTSGKDGVLRFLRCDACRRYVHPPAPVCGYCRHRQLHPEAVSGRATLHSFTVNHQPWDGGLTPVPYVIGLVEIEEQDDVRLTTNIVNCEPGDVKIGMPLQVLFEDQETVWIPLFEPVRP